MLVLLPPSEGKATVDDGAPLDLEALSLPGLTAAREAVLAELVELCSADAEKASDVLGLSPGLRGEVARNAQLRTAPARPAGRIYTGVLYDHLGLSTLTEAARRRAAEALLVFSALWGAVGVEDRIPAYRCSGGVKLPGLGGLAAHWRVPMAEVMPDAVGDGMLLDLRSSAYTPMWKPKGELAERTATVRVLHATVVDGQEKRTVVSHFNKATKGRIVRALLECGADPRTPVELAGVLRELGHTVEVEPPKRSGAPWRLDVVVTQV